MDKEGFLKEYGEDYGYPNGPKSIDEIRATEFKRLQNGTVYLDHAGATLYSELQMEAILKDLTSSVLEYFNASPRDYKCIFTSGATAALKLVLSALIDSRYALSQGAAAFAIDIEEELHHSGICDAHSVKMSQHPVQRRKDARSLERDPTGQVLWSRDCRRFFDPKASRYCRHEMALDAHGRRLLVTSSSVKAPIYQNKKFVTEILIECQLSTRELIWRQ
ncbi:MoCo sulfurase [Tripterygium wilfordii]|uniref:MoCo sulfurase n=1 Tax=Tripterygium wilfordii TaxID=458696 RepID=A0A7J7CAR6_TRIWF|nr:MoCo sulfurase [Tripterygium wilfordii]